MAPIHKEVEDSAECVSLALIMLWQKRKKTDNTFVNCDCFSDDNRLQKFPIVTALKYNSQSATTGRSWPAAVRLRQKSWRSILWWLMRYSACPLFVFVLHCTLVFNTSLTLLQGFLYVFGGMLDSAYSNSRYPLWVFDIGELLWRRAAGSRWQDMLLHVCMWEIFSTNVHRAAIPLKE